MKIQPLGKKLAVVKLKNKEEATESGLILTKSLDNVDKAKVIAIGPEVTEVKVGETLLIDWKKATQTTVDNIPIFVLKEEDVVGVFD